MPRWNQSRRQSQTTSELVQAIKLDKDLSDEDWDALWKTATPQQRRVARLMADPTLAPHGVPSTYTNWGCGCGPCRASLSTDRVKKSFPDAPAPSSPAADLAAAKRTDPRQRTNLQHCLIIREEQGTGPEAMTDAGRAILDAYDARDLI